MLNLGETFPNYKGPSTQGTIDIYEYFGNSWGILFSHPADYTPVCTTEISRMAQLTQDFKKRNVKVLCLSIDKLEDHNGWVTDVEKVAGCTVPFPLVADESGEYSEKIGMLDKGQDKRITVRGVFVIDPEKKIKAIICYPASTGRNFDEILRLVDSLQLTNERKDIVTPVDWKQGGDVLVKPGSEVQGANKVDLPSGKSYLQFVKP